MTFDVRPEALRRAARELDELAAAAAAAVGYAAHTEPATAGGSAMVRLLAATAPVRPAVEEFFEHLGRLSEESADELVAAAHRYEEADRHAAEAAYVRRGRVDAVALPTGPGGEGGA